jgi:hypothetical protein
VDERLLEHIGFTRSVPSKDLERDKISDFDAHYHATLQKHVPSILRKGLLPAEDSGVCLYEPLGDDDCSASYTYFWNSLEESYIQADNTYREVSRARPAILIMDLDGLELEIDTEIADEEYLNDIADEVLEEEGFRPELTVESLGRFRDLPVRHNGKVTPERIRCVCLGERYDKRYHRWTFAPVCKCR